MKRNPAAGITPAHTRFASVMRRVMERDGYTRASLAAALGVTPTMVGYWRYGRYLPGLLALDRLVALFPDDRIGSIVMEARTGRCVCGSTFDREQSRRAYCSFACQRAAHRLGGRKADARQDAIDAMCAGCEPEGICRDDACALRPFSPFLFVALHRRSA